MKKLKQHDLDLLKEYNDQEHGKTKWVFVAVYTRNPSPDDPTVHLGVAVEGVKGYFPIGIAYCYGESYKEMMAYAQEINIGMDMHDDEAMKITLGSMFGKVGAS